MTDFLSFEHKFLFIPIGGSNEIGMNMNLYHYEGKWIIVDCGAGFCDQDSLGGDIIIPDYNFLLERKEDILGLLITHAHNDHIGAVTFFLQECNIPIYTTKFSADFLQFKLSDKKCIAKADIRIINNKQTFSLGLFHITPVNLLHSIAVLYQPPPWGFTTTKMYFKAHVSQHK